MFGLLKSMPRKKTNKLQPRTFAERTEGKDNK